MVERGTYTGRYGPVFVLQCCVRGNALEALRHTVAPSFDDQPIESYCNLREVDEDVPQTLRDYSSLRIC